MRKILLTLMLLCTVLASGLVACSSSNNGVPEENAVHMTDNEFVQSSITIKKGENITLIADTFTPHFIANGTWEQDSAKPGKEPGAPEINNVEVNGNTSSTFGPFNSSGTFQLYCTIHKGMNLTVIVQ